MLKNLFSCLLAGLLIFAYSDAFAQEPVPDQQKEFWMGAGLSRPTNTGPTRTVFTPRFMYKVAKNKWHRRYSLLLSSNWTNSNSSVNENQIFIERENTEGFFDFSFGIGAERRIPVGKRGFFYAGSEVLLLTSIESYKSVSTHIPEVVEDSRKFDSRRSVVRPGLGLNLVVGFHYNLLPRLSASLEFVPGINALVNLYKDKDVNTTAPGTPSESIFSNSSTSANVTTGIHLLSPAFVQIGYRF